MIERELTSVDDYIALQPESARPVLQQVRQIIRKALPEADEVISYKMPTYKLRGRAVLYLAGWRAHYSLYPSTARLLEAFKADLAPYELSGKGSIRFPLSAPVPARLIARLATFRAREVLERQGARR